MRNRLVGSMIVTLVFVLAVAGPALAQEAGEGSSRPWHYWIAPFLLAAGVLAVAAVGVGYWIRVMGGRPRR